MCKGYGEREGGDAWNVSLWLEMQSHVDDDAI
jgi:hypothetical protein